MSGMFFGTQCSCICLQYVLLVIQNSSKQLIVSSSMSAAKVKVVFFANTKASAFVASFEYLHARRTHQQKSVKRALGYSGVAEDMGRTKSNCP